MPNRRLIRNALLVNPEIDPFRADILIDNGMIAAIESPETITVDADFLDGSSFISIPGLVNAHTHSHNAISRGLGDRWTLELLLNYGPALNARRTPEDHYWSALLNGIEMLKSGTTAAYDLVIHAPRPTIESIEAVVQAYRDLGMRAVVAPAVADLPFYAILPGLLESLPDFLRREIELVLPSSSDVLLATLADILRSVKQDDRVRLAVAPTIPHQCSDDFLLGCANVARERGVGLHTHLAESRVQAIAGLERYGTSLTMHLSELGLLGPDFVAAHCVWLDDEDARVAADAGVVVAHNPASNLKLGSGVAPVAMFQEAGLDVAIGTDGSASSDNQDMFEAMRFAALVSRIGSVDPARWLDARTTLRMATAGGCHACGLHASTGKIAPGEPADMVFLRSDSIHLQPRNDLHAQMVYSENGSAVDTVLVGGDIILQGGKPTRVDEQAVYRNAQSAIERVLTLNAAEWEFARRLTPYIVETCSALAARPLPVSRLLPGATVN
jgi:guanine deaminase